MNCEPHGRGRWLHPAWHLCLDKEDRTWRVPGCRSSHKTAVSEMNSLSNPQWHRVAMKCDLPVMSYSREPNSSVVRKPEQRCRFVEPSVAATVPMLLPEFRSLP